jgi:uncharacterized RDD family membrane protein YckC
MTKVPSLSQSPASVGRRLSAYLLDSAILSLVGIGVAAIASVAGPTLAVAEQPDGTLRLLIDPVRLSVQAAALALVSAAYFAWSWSRPPGATLGQRALGIGVVDAGGRPLTARRAFARWAALGLPIGIVAAALVELPVAWLLVVVVATIWTIALLVSTRRDERRRGFHDRLSGSVVVRRSATDR